MPITVDDLVAAAVRDGIAYADLPVRMGASMRKSTNAFDAVDVSVQAVLPAGIKGPLITEISVTDTSGQPKGARRILEAQPDGRFVASYLFPLKAGGYTIRFAAADAEGRLGSVEMAVPVSLPRLGSVTASDVITWVAVDGKPQVFTADEVPAAATSINASIELYPTGVLSMAERHVHWSVLPVAGGAPAFEADAPAPAGPAFLRSDVEVPWSRLAPGGYTIRATLVVGGAPEGAMAATVVKK